MITTPPIGSVLVGRYELIGHIARGGMGDVFEAEDQQLARRVAVKVFRAAAGDRSRFDSEVGILAALNHPGLVRVYDAGEQDGDAFVVLELIDGPTLASRLRGGGPHPPREVAQLGVQLAEALAYVHRHGVVHRDVTPSNVLCGPDGRVRLADFGIARLVDTTRITAATTTVGTAAYMSPEQVQGHDVTPAADVYTLGLLLLEVLTGRRAFIGSQKEVAMARLLRDPDIETDVPAAWHDLLRAMTDRSPSSRPTAAEVSERLQQIGSDAAVTPAISSDRTMAMPAALIPVEEPRPRRRRRVLVAAVVGLLLLTVGAAVAIGYDPDPSTPANATTAPAVPSTTQVPIAPTTTAPPVSPTTTQAPAAPESVTQNVKGKGKGNGEGNGKGKDR